MKDFNFSGSLNEALLDLKHQFVADARQLQKDTVIDILQGLHYQNYMRECDYNKMTGEEVVQQLIKALDNIQAAYGITDGELDL